MSRFIYALRFNSIQLQTDVLVTLANLAILFRHDTQFRWYKVFLCLWPWCLSYVSNVIDPLPKKEGNND